MTRRHAVDLEKLPFPARGSSREKLHFALNAAILAPSGHNTQPWLFRLHEDYVDIRADRRRRLPVIDPQDRELTISCGAALFNLRVALEAHGLGCRVHLLPEEADSDLLARVHLTEASGASPLARLWPAIPRRHTHRLPFQDRQVESDVLWAMQEAGLAEGCRFLPLTGELKNEAIGLIGEVDVRVATDPLYRQALDRWITTHIEADGVQVAEGIEITILDDFAASLPRWLMRFKGNGQARGERDQELARRAPLLALLAAPGDTVCHWLMVGQGLQRVLLEGALAGLQASYLNQPLELPDTRAWLARWTSGTTPHLMLRMGYPEHEHRSPPRRALADLVEEVP